MDRPWLRELRVAAETFDWAAVSAVTDEYAGQMWESPCSPDLVEVREILELLRVRLRYDELRRVAEAALGSGLEHALVRRQYAQALVDEGKPAAALRWYREILADPQVSAFERAEARGGLGRCHKELFLRTRDPARRRASLVAALRCYHDAYLEDGRLFWHGINVVALLMRAGRAGIDVRDCGLPDAAEIAARVLATVDDAEPTGWTRMAGCEAMVALGRFDEAARRAGAMVEAPEVGAFALNSMLRQLVEVWQLRTDRPPGDRLLPLLRSALLERHGGSVRVDQRDVRSSRLAALTGERLEKVFGATRFQSLTWYRNGLVRCRAVARIADVNDHAVGTGFLVAGPDLHPALPRLVLLTNGHVVPEGVPAHGAVVTFHALGTEHGRRAFRVRRICWYEPSQRPGLDTSVLELDDYPPAVDPVPIAAELPTGANARAYVIGHPLGLTQPQFSLQDNVVLDHDDRVVHYRSPTEPGSSGSPVFDHVWNLIALHHSGSATQRRLRDAGSYEANEGIAVPAIRAGLRERPPGPGDQGSTRPARMA